MEADSPFYKSEYGDSPFYRLGNKFCKKKNQAVETGL